MTLLIRISVLLAISVPAFAKTSVAKDASCAQLLSDRPTIVDYALSDLEGSFFDLLAKMEAANEVDPRNAQYYVHQLLNQKADLLNKIVQLMPVIGSQGMLDSVYQILDSLGVPVEAYGLKLDKDGRVVKNGQTVQYKNPPPEVSLGAPIGFLHFKGERADVPEGSFRTIGFAPHKIETHAPPERRTGQIRRTILPKNPDTLFVMDEEKGKLYKVDMRVIQLHGVEFETHKYLLTFNQEIMEWMVAVENLENPTGKIGF